MGTWPIVLYSVKGSDSTELVGLRGKDDLVVKALTGTEGIWILFPVLHRLTCDLG